MQAQRVSAAIAYRCEQAISFTRSFSLFLSASSPILLPSPPLPYFNRAYLMRLSPRYFASHSSLLTFPLFPPACYASRGVWAAALLLCQRFRLPRGPEQGAGVDGQQGKAGRRSVAGRSCRCSRGRGACVGRQFCGQETVSYGSKKRQR